MKFSFIIPAYNNKRLLANTLLALNMQKGYGVGDYEVIVIDDGSPERLFDYIKEVPWNYQLKYIYIDRLPSSCRAGARNKGLEIAIGKVVIFIDSDMLVNENYLSEVERYFKVDENICLMSTRLYADREIQSSEIVVKTVFNKYNFKGCRVKHLENRHVVFNSSSYNANVLKTPWLFTYSCNLAVSRKNLEMVGGFDENYKGWGYEDVDLGYRLYKRGIKIVINHKMEAIHQYHGDSSVFFSWSHNKFNQIRSNEDYFYEKYREIEQIIPFYYKRERFYIFQKFRLHTFVSKKSRSRKTYKLSLKNNSEFEKILKMLEEKASIKGEKSLIYIYDYMENTNIDILIQLYNSSSCMIRYYPISRCGKSLSIVVISLLYMFLRALFGVNLILKESIQKFIGKGQQRQLG
ncbi:MAG TPA: glycosyltransferase [Pseudobacteroides sp.]|uniref:glycosyltransferase family 2 protein n=1 Tax=Pseudobacteroides sp. TaxID=1968840 RepID=UPI002F9526A7